MSSSIAGLFPGQGSQTVGMCSEFFSGSEQARDYFEKADLALGFPLSKLCFEGPIEELTLTQYAQPAILVTSYVCFKESNISIQTAAGHSLGEYTAVLAAGCIDFADVVQLVHKRGHYMQEAVPAGEGKMLAVMGQSEEKIESVISDVESGIVEIANLNSPGQIVVAGDAEGIDLFAERIAANGAKCIPLNVSAPFHCRLMKPAAEQLAKDLDAITFRTPDFPVYSNVTANIITNGEQVRELLKAQVCSSVRWTDLIINMLREQSVTHTVEFGPGGILSKLLKRIDKQPARLEVFDHTSLEKSTAQLG